MKERRELLTASQAADECTVFGKSVASGLRKFKSELNHTVSEEKKAAFHFEIEVSIFFNCLRGSSRRRSPLKMEQI